MLGAALLVAGALGAPSAGYVFVEDKLDRTTSVNLKPTPMTKMKEVLMHKYMSMRLDVEQLKANIKAALPKDKLDAAAKATKKSRHLQGDSFESALQQIIALCDAPGISVGELLGDDTGAVEQCVCANDFDMDAMSYVFADGPETSIDGLCTASCTSFIMLLSEGRRRLAEAPTPQEVEGRALQASPSPWYEMFASPSPENDEADISFETLWTCACAYPAVIGVAGVEDLTSSMEDDLCGISACEDLVKQSGLADCGDGFGYEYATTVAVTAAGDVSDFTPDVVGQLEAEFAEIFGVNPSQCDIEVVAGSVQIIVTIYTDDEDAASAVESSMEELDEDTLTAQLSSVRGANGQPLVQVEAISEPETEEVEEEKSLLDRLNIPIPVIAGAAGGGAAFLVLVIVIWCCFCQPKKKKGAQPAAV